MNGCLKITYKDASKGTNTSPKDQSTYMPSKIIIQQNPFQDSVIAGHKTSLPMQVLVTDEQNNPVANQEIIWSIDASVGTLDNLTILTDAQGVATNNVTLIHKGTQIISAALSSFPDLKVTFEAEVVSAEPNLQKSKIILEDSSIVQTSGITNVSVTIQDVFNNPIASQTIILESNRNINNVIVDVFSPASVITNADGSAVFHVSSSQLGSAEISAKIANTSFELQAQTLAVVTSNQNTISYPNNNQLVGVMQQTISWIPTGAPVGAITYSISNTDQALLAQLGLGLDSSTGIISGTILNSQSAFVVPITVNTTGGTQNISAQITLQPFGATSSSNSSASPSTNATTVGSTASITVTLKDQYNNPISNKQVALVSSRGNQDTIQSSQTVTDSNGQMLFQISSQTQGTAILSAMNVTDNLLISSSIASLSFNPVTSYQILNISGGNQNNFFAGTTTNPFTIRVKDASGNPVSGVTIDWTLTEPNVVNAVNGSLTTTSTQTDVNGDALNTAVLKIAGTNTITATIHSTNISTNFQQVVRAGFIDLSKLVLSFSNNSIIANGTSTTLTASIYDTYYNPLSSKALQFSSSRNVDNLSSSAVQTNASGQASIIITSTQIGSSTITLKDNTNQTLGSANLSITTATMSAANSILSASASSITVGNSSNITVTLKDIYNNPLVDKQVSLSSSRGGQDSIQTTQTLTDSNGEFVFQISSTTAGNAIFSASNVTDNIAVFPSVSSITFTPGSAAQIALISGGNQANFIAGSLTNSLTVLVSDIYNNPVPSALVSWSLQQPATSGVTSGSLTQATTQTNSSGNTSNTALLNVAGANAIQASINNNAVSVSFNQAVNAGGLSTAQISNISGGSQANFSAGTTTNPFKIRVKDAIGNPLSGITIDWTLTEPTVANAVSGSLTTSGTQTDANGEALNTAVLKVAGNNTITATILGTSMSTSFQQFVLAGPIELSKLVLSFSNNSIIANQGSTTLTASIYDAYANPLSSKTLQFSSSRNTDTLSASTVQTNASGQANVTITATQPGSSTITLKDNTNQILGTTNLSVITGAMSAANSTLNASASSITVGDTGTITVSLKDIYNNPLADKQVSLSSSRGNQDSIQTSQALTDSDGQIVFQISSTVAGNAIFSASNVTDNIAVFPSISSITFNAGSAAHISAVSGGNQTNFIAGSSTNSLTVLVSDIYNNPLASIPVSWSLQQPSASGVTPGSLTQVTTQTNSSGNTSNTAVLNVAGANVIQASINNNSVSVSFNQTVNAGGLSNAQISNISGGNQASFVAGTTTNSLKVRVKDSLGNPISGVMIDWTLTEPTVANAVNGNLANASTQTDVNGDAINTAVLKIAGTNTITATIHGTSINTSFQQNVLPAAIDLSKLVLSFSNNPIIANQGSTTLTASIYDTYANPLSSKTLEFSSSRNTDNLSASTAQTNASGQANITISATQSGSSTITLKDNTNQTLGTANLSVTTGAMSATNSVLSASASSITVGNNGNITVTLKDIYSNPLANKQVGLSSSRGNQDSIQTSQALTDSNGQLVFQISSTVAGNATFSATNLTDNIAIFPSVSSITFNAGSAAHISAISGGNEANFIAGSVTNSLTVLVSDSYNNPLASVPVSWSLQQPSTSGVTPGSLTQTTTQTNSSGNSSNTALLNIAGANVIQASINNNAVSVSFNQTVNAGSTAQISNTSGGNEANFSAGTTTNPFSLRVKDSLGNPISGVTIDWTLTEPTVANALNGSLANASTQTDTNGDTTNTAVLKIAGTNTITATIHGTSINTSFQQTVSTGAIDLSKLVLSFSTNPIIANGNSTTLTASIYDTYYNPLSSKTLQFSSSRNTDNLSSASAQTNTSGQASITISSTQVGSSTITLKDNTNQTLGSTSLSVTTAAMSASNSGLSASESSITVGSSGNITVTLKDIYNNPLANKQVALSSSRGGQDSIQTSQTLTDSNGQFVFQVSSTVAGNATFSANNITDNIAVFPSVSSITFNAGSATQISAVSGGNQASFTSGSVTNNLTVLVSDSYNNPVASVPVSWSLQQPTASGVTSGSLTQASTQTNSSGNSSNTALLNVAGANVIQASINNNSVSVSFNQTVNVGALSTSTSVLSVSPALDGSNTTYVLNDNTSTISVQYTALDAAKNPISGLSITLSSSRNSGSTIDVIGSSDTQITNASGIVSFTVKSAQSGTAILSLQANSASVATFSLAVQALPIIAANQTTTYVGSDISTSISFTSTGGVISSCSTSPSLPSGMSINATSCQITGTTKDVSYFGKKTYQVTAANGVGSSQATINIITQQSSSSGTQWDKGCFCGFKSDGSFVCWGYCYGTTITTPTAVFTDTGSSTVLMWSMGDKDTQCILKSDNTVWCRAVANSNTCPTLSATSSTQITGFPAGKKITQLTTDRGLCALIEDGTVYCLGSNYAGQLGNNSTSDNCTTNAPTKVQGLSEVIVNISKVYDASCGVSVSNKLYCWGNMSNQQLGSTMSGNILVATQHPTLTNVSKVIHGTCQGGNYAKNICILNTANTVYCWGPNDVYQSGTGLSTTPILDATYPVIMTDNSVVSNVAILGIGTYSNFALLSTNDIIGWGSSYRGSLGPVADYSQYSKAFKIFSSPPANIITLQAAQTGACVTTNTGMVQCWGEGGTGQMGNGTTTSTNSSLKTVSNMPQ